MSHRVNPPVRSRAGHNGETVTPNRGNLENHPSVRVYYAGRRAGAAASDKVRWEGGVLAALRRMFGGPAPK